MLIFSEWFIKFFFLSRNGSQEREENDQKREAGQIRSKFMVRLELIIPPTILFSCTRECSLCFYLHSSFRRILIMPSQPLKHAGTSVFLKWGSLPFGGHLVMSGNTVGRVSAVDIQKERPRMLLNLLQSTGQPSPNNELSCFRGQQCGN